MANRGKKAEVVTDFLFLGSKITADGDCIDCNMPGFPVHHQLPEFTQTHVHWVGDAIQHLILCFPLLLLQSFPASGSFPMSWLFKSGGQSIGASASASVFPMNIQGWFPLELTGFDLLAVQGTPRSLLQHHILKTSILRPSAFFMVQFSLPYVTTGKTIALTIQTFIGFSTHYLGLS